MKTRTEIAQDFINDLIGPLPADSCVELRQKRPGEKGSRPSFYEDVSQIDVEHMGTDENIWFSIVLRKIGTTTGRQGDLTWGTCAWADFDGLDEAGKLRVTGILKRFPHPPTMIVDSGGGVHAYWRFNRPLNVNAEHQTTYLREVVHGLSQALGADTSVHDLPRMMRVAGTLNPGNGTTKVYNPPRDVKVVYHDLRTVYDVSDLSRYRKPVTVRARQILSVPANSPSTPVLAALRIGKRMKDYIQNGLQPGDPLYKSRSELDNAACVALLSGGHTDSDIFAIFRDPSYGISEKYVEKGADGDRYLATTLANAKSYLSQRSAPAPQNTAPLNAIGPALPGVRERGGLVEAEGHKGWYTVLTRPIRAIGRLTGAVEGFRVEIDSTIGTARRTLSSDMLAAGIPFKKALRNAAQWLGNDRDVQLLAMYLDAQNPPLKHAVATVGWAPSNDLVVFPNAQIVGGVLENESDYLYAGQVEDARLVESSDWPLLARTVLPMVVDLQRNGAAIPALGWFMASFLAPKLRPLDHGAFPFLMLFGRTEAGKTNTLKLLRTLCGYNPEDENAADQESKFTTTDLLNAFNTVPVLLDEYKAADPPRGLHGLLHHAYAGGTASRGQADLSVKRFRLRAPVALAGETPFRVDALRQRTVNVKFEPDEKNEPTFNALIALPLEEFSLGMYQHVWNVDVPVLWRQAQQVLPQEIKDISDIRQRKGWAVVAFGLMLVKDFFPPGVVDGYISKLHTWRYEPPVSMGGASGKQVLIEAVRIMTELIRNRQMQDGQEFIIQIVNNEHHLWFVPSLVLPLIEIHAARQRTDLPMARESVLEYMRANHKAQKGLVVRYQDTVKVGGRTHRGIALSLEQVEKDMQIDVDYWTTAAIMGSDKL